MPTFKLNRDYMILGKLVEGGTEYNTESFSERELKYLNKYIPNSVPQGVDSAAVTDEDEAESTTVYEPQNVTKGALALIQDNALTEIEVEAIRSNTEDGRISQSDVESFLGN